MSSFTINRVVLIGRLTRDPELRALPSGTSVCAMRIACNSSRRDTDGEFQERPNYFDVTVSASAESVSRYMSKGSRVAIDGRLQWREWESEGKEHRQSVSVVADTVQFLDAPGEHGGAQGEVSLVGARGVATPGAGGCSHREHPPAAARHRGACELIRSRCTVMLRQNTDPASWGGSPMFVRVVRFSDVKAERMRDWWLASRIPEVRPRASRRPD